MNHKTILLGAIALIPSPAFAQTVPVTSPPTSGSDIVVTARREKTARDEEQAALNIVDIQAAETIAKYPDINAAEALSRIPGVALSIDTAEGRFINIRGLDGNLNGATFGGVVLLNTQPGGTNFSGSGRAVEFDTVPIGAIDRIVVTKTGLPDHEAEGLGGSIELTPRTAIGATKPFADITLGGGIETFRSSALFRDEVVIGQSFGGTNADGKSPFAVVFTQFNYTDRRGFDDLEAAYVDGQADGVPDKVFDALEFRRYNYHRQRFGYSGEFDVTPNDSTRLFARVSYAGYNESVRRYIFAPSDLGADAIVDPANPAGFIARGARAQKSTRFEDESHHNFVGQVGGEHDLGRGIKLDYFAAYSEASYSKPFDLNTTFTGPGDLTIAYDNTTNPNFPTIRQVAGADYLSNANYALTRETNSTELSVDRERSGAANLSAPLHFLGDDTLKIGFKIRRRTKYQTRQAFTYSLLDGQTAPGLVNFLDGGPYTDFYGSRYNIGQQPQPSAVRDFVNGNQALFTTPPTAGDIARANGAFFRDTENVTAGYGQYQVILGKLNFLAGLRVEHTRSVYRGIARIVTPSAVVGGDDLIAYSPVSTPRSYTNFFPAAQLRLQATPTVILRATYSTGISRPGFNQTIQSANVDVATNTATIGNPNLKPTTGNNFDLAATYSPSETTFLTIGVFDKEFKNYIVGNRNLAASVSLPGLTAGVGAVTAFANVPNARARGIEVSGAIKFTSLPGLLKGFGIDANGTYVDSRAQIRNGVFIPLPGTFKYTANAALFYELGRVQLRGAAQYESSALFGVGGTRALDAFQDKRFTVDFNGSYTLSRNLSFFTNVKNLTNAPLRFYEGSRNRPIQREFYDYTIEGGIKVHL